MNANNDPYPTLVVEVAISESVGSLHALAAQYFNARTTIRAYLAVKVWEQRNDGTFAALALLYLRSNNPNTTLVQAISFGTSPIHGNSLNSLPPVIHNPNNSIITGVISGPLGQPCNQAGLATFQINMPLAEIYHGVPGSIPAQVPSAPLQIDLFLLQGVAY